MTPKEVKNQLQGLKSLGRAYKSAKEELEDFKRDIYALSLPGINYEGERVKGGQPSSKVEQIYLKLSEKADKFEELLHKYIEEETKVLEQIQSLPPMEKEVIVERFIKGRSAVSVARRMNYSVESVYIIQRKAIKNIATKK